MGSSRTRYAVILLAVAAVAGLTVSAVLVFQSVTVDHVDQSGAREPFDEALAHLESKVPIVTIDASGRVVRLELSRREMRPTRLYVLAYRSSHAQLVRADVPLWFYKVKGPAAQYILRGTGFDLERLGLTAADLERAGAGVVIDEIGNNGDRLLAWTE